MLTAVLIFAVVVLVGLLTSRPRPRRGVKLATGAARIECHTVGERQFLVISEGARTRVVSL